MYHFVKIYPGNYEIKEANGNIYLYQPKEKMKPKYFHFCSDSDRETIMGTILELNLYNDREILNFLSSYGLLGNTLNDPDNPTYCGLPVAKETNDYISPFTSGIAMPRFLFRHFIKLLKNVFMLSTELAKYKSKSINYDKEENVLKILNFFLNLLFQPYTLTENTFGYCSIIEGITPLSRFASSYHEAVLKMLRIKPAFLFSEFFIKSFIDGFKKLVDINYSKRRHIPPASKKPETETDIPVFKPNEHFPLYLSWRDQQGNIIQQSYNFPPKFYYDTSTDEYYTLSETLFAVGNYCKYSFDNKDALEVSFIDESAFLSDNKLMENICNLSKKLVIDTLNTYTSNIRFSITDFDENKLTEEEYEKYKKSICENSHANTYMYNFVHESHCLLQALFFEASNMLNKYGVDICKYPGCNKTIYYKNARPKQCCCHKHTDNYCKLKKRNSKKLKRK